jgi:hypothetical protein
MNRSKLAGWILSFLIAAMLAGPSAGGKLIDFEGKEEMFGKLGWPTGTMFYVAFVEIACAMLFLLPRTGFLGAILLTGYLGGAAAAHVRVSEPFFMPILIGVFVWIALGLRNPAVIDLAVGSAGSKPGKLVEK